ncbi:CARDB domain-containing protein [Microcoleus sp. B4-D1]|uniref:CARDB domain-containing protein n=1 Tax=Microcoleus sp. B4-D1 TaxID=2818666 RepID=UPI002FD58E54
MPVNFAGSYTQNFDSLANTGTPTWTNDTTLPGWFLYRQPATPAATAITAYTANNGAIGTGNFYSYGSTSSTDRALGGLGSGGAYFGSPTSGNIAGWIAFSATNTTGSTINSLNVSFNGEQWRNNGNATAQPMVLEYGLGATFDSVTWTVPGGNFDWTSPVATTTAAAVDGNVAGQVAGRGGALTGLNWANNNTLWFRWVERNDSGNDHGLAIDDFSLSLPAQPDLTITSSAPANATVSTPFDYTLTLTNSGTGNATGVSAQFTLPGGVTYNSASGTGFTATQAAGVVTFSGGAIAAGGTVPLTINVTPTVAGTLTSAAGAAVADPANAIAETSETNNSSSTIVNTIVAATSEPDLTITSSAPANATVNTPFDYTLTLNNAGTGNATGVSAQFTLPAGVTYNSASGTGFTATQAGGVVTFTGTGAIAAGGSVPLTINVTPTVAGTLTSAAGAAVADPGNAIAETSETNNSSSTIVNTIVAATSEPDLTITSSAPANATVNTPFDYTLTLTNSGTAATPAGVTANFTLPANVTYNSASGTGYTVTQAGGVVTFTGTGAIAAGGSVPLTVNVTPTVAGTLTSATGAAVADPANAIAETSETNNSSTAVTTTVAPPPQPDLTITSSAPANATVNTPFDYTLTLTNSGTAATPAGVTANFTLPAGVTYNSASGTGFTATQAAGVVTFSGGAIAAGGTVPLTINVTPTVAGTLTSAAGAAVADPGSAIPESNETNNSSTAAVSTTVSAAPAIIRIRDIQAASHRSPLVSTTVTNVPGVVTGLITGSGRGFYMQDPTPDTGPNPNSTSEAVFVFLGSSTIPNPTVGQSVQVTGRVDEFRPANNATNLTTTQINATVSGAALGAIAPLGTITPTIIGNGGRIQPTTSIQNDFTAAGNVETGGDFDPTTEGIDFYESLEGMLVQVNNPVVVGPTNNFGEFYVLADNGANATGRTSRGGIAVSATDFNPERIQIDDTLLNPPSNTSLSPLTDVGDKLGTVSGVIGYSFSNYELLNTAQIPQSSVISGGLTKEVTNLTGNANQLTVGNFNVENLDPGDTAKFPALASRIVTNLKSPDIINIEEIQDNNGATNDGVVAADTTYNTLISAIQAAGGPTYEFRQINPVNNQDGGEPGGNIRVGFLFNPSRVTFVDRPGGTSTTATTVNTVSGAPALSASPGRIDPTNAAFNSSRKPLVGEFLFNGQSVFVIVNHFNSKGGDQPLYGPTQPPVLTSETQRLQQAQIVNNFVDSILAVDANANVIVAGDLNDFQFSEPLNVVRGIPGGSGTAVLQNLIETLPENERYTYNFQGNAQVLDHILASNNLATNLAGFDVVHINSEFADQDSDHDPSVARFNIPLPTVTITATDAAAAESGNPGIFRIARSGSTSLPLTVNYTTASGTGFATSDDFTPNLTGSIIIPAGQSFADVTITPVDDTIVESSEAVKLTLVAAAGYNLGTAGTETASVAIADNDVFAPGTFNFSSGTYSVNENGATQTITVNRTGGSNVSASVSYSTSDGSATAGSDYTATSGTFNFLSGETTKTFSILITDDTLLEGNETLNLSLSNPTNGASLGTQNTASLTIVDTTPTGTPTPDPSPSPTPTGTPTPDPSPSPTPTGTPTPTPTGTPTPTPTGTPTPTPTGTPTPTPTGTPTPTPTGTPTPDPNCIGDRIERPNLDRPNPVDNIINGNSGILIGTPRNDGYFGNSPNIFNAKAGNDNLIGGNSPDIFNGNEGNDFINGNRGNDILLGGKGNDIIIGGEDEDLIFGDKGNDSINGKEGNDFIYGNAGVNFIDGGKGNDILIGGKDSDAIVGSQGSDSIFGQFGDDTLCGDAGNDLLCGNENNDLIDGGAGNDTIYGGENSDTLLGCTGSDLLFGDLGDDSLIGGLGNDTFAIGNNLGIDIISDFVKGEDVLGLSRGLSFNQLEISQSNNSALIKVNGIAIASLTGVNASLIDVNDFRTV